MTAKLLVFPTRLTSLDIEALRDRARVEKDNPTAIARKAIRYYLTQTIKIENPPAA